MANGNNPKERSAGKNGTGAKSKLDALFGDAPETVGQADWGACDPRWLQAVVTAVNTVGGAVSFGLSRDQGAHSLMVLLDGERKTLWFPAGSDLDAELEKVFHLFNTK